MENREAIEKIVLDHCNKCADQLTCFMCPYSIAKHAIALRIPIRPREKVTTFFATNRKMVSDTHYTCPKCDHTVGFANYYEVVHPKVCYECGQELDWSDFE